MTSSLLAPVRPVGGTVQTGPPRVFAVLIVLTIMYDKRDKNTNSPTNGSIKYISNAYGGVMQNEIYCNKIMIICIF